MNIWRYCVVGDWTYGGNVVLVDGYMEVLCVLLNGHKEVLCVLENGYMVVLCVLVNGHMELMWCW